MVMNANTAALAEGLGLGAALGLDLDMLREVFAQTGAQSQVLKTDGEDMQNRAHECYFSAAHAAKDSTIAWVARLRGRAPPAGRRRDQAAVREARQPRPRRPRQERRRGAHVQGPPRLTPMRMGARRATDFPAGFACPRCVLSGRRAAIRIVRSPRLRPVVRDSMAFLSGVSAGWAPSACFLGSDRPRARPRPLTSGAGENQESGAAAFQAPAARRRGVHGRLPLFVPRLRRTSSRASRLTCWMPWPRQ